MKYKTLGKSGLITSNLTLGTMIFGESSSRATPKDEAQKMINYYIGEGGNHIDTADVYAGGLSEEIVGASVKGRRQNILVATKVRFPMGDNPNLAGLSRLHILEGVHASLKRLQTDYLDLLYIHSWDPLTPLEETLRALEDLVRSGKVRYLGISNFKAWQLMKAQGLCKQLSMNSFIAGQYQYSLVKRDMEYEFFDLMESEGIGLTPWGPLGGGFLTGKYDRNLENKGRIFTSSDQNEESWERRNTDKNWAILDKVKSLAETYNTTPTQISIAWILSRKIVSSVVLGARTIDQLKDNMGANNVRLLPDEIESLDRLSDLPELYPYRFIKDYAKRDI
ncbi:MAG: aldo/keto reductase [Saonia sp.]